MIVQNHRAGKAGDYAQVSLLGMPPPAQPKLSYWDSVCKYPGPRLEGEQFLFILGNFSGESQIFSCNKRRLSV